MDPNVTSYAPYTNSSNLDEIVKNFSPRQEETSPTFDSLTSYRNLRIKDTIFPRFTEGVPYFTVLTNVENEAGELNGIMIDAVSMDLGRDCEGATFKVG